MERDLRNSVCGVMLVICGEADLVEHTLLVTDVEIEVLTARLPTSPGGPVVEVEEAGDADVDDAAKV